MGMVGSSAVLSDRSESRAVGVSRSAPLAVAAKGSAAIVGKSSGTLSARPFDLHRFKAVFPDKWAAFLKAHFHTSARVAAFFDVDDKTARNWLHVVNSPSGPHAIYAVEALPGLREYLMGDAA